MTPIRKPVTKRRPGKVAMRVPRLVRERRRLLAIRADITAAYELDCAEMRAVYEDHMARIATQPRDLDRGQKPTTPREDD